MALLTVGTPAPTFKGMNLTGPEVDLENYKGKKAVCLVFAPDSVDPAQTTALKALAAKVQDKVEVVTIVRKIPGVPMAKAFLQQLGYKFPVVYDASMALFKSFGVESPVAVFIIDANGSIVYAAQSGPLKVDIKAIGDALAANVK
ncbi:MAG: TlpA family protein disulfide reductase [Chloroflexi bacterium]|nr:TlpA family protein disulfide reductase [Chloroflexota bacterium]